MIVVKVELWPGGDESRKKTLGLAHIANDESGSQTVGNYVVKLFKWSKPGAKPSVWKSGSVRGFPRLRLGPWDLLYRALDGIVGSRNG